MEHLKFNPQSGEFGQPSKKLTVRVNAQLGGGGGGEIAFGIDPYMHINAMKENRFYNLKKNCLLVFR